MDPDSPRHHKIRHFSVVEFPLETHSSPQILLFGEFLAKNWAELSLLQWRTPCISFLNYFNARFEGGHGKDGGATNAVYKFTENFEYHPIGHLEHERTLHRSIRQGSFRNDIWEITDLDKFWKLKKLFPSKVIWFWNCSKIILLYTLVEMVNMVIHPYLWSFGFLIKRRTNSTFIFQSMNWMAGQDIQKLSWLKKMNLLLGTIALPRKWHFVSHSLCHWQV